MLENEIAKLVDLFLAVSAGRPTDPIKPATLWSFGSRPNHFSRALQLVDKSVHSASLNFSL